MSTNERFDQLESFLVNLAKKVDRLDEKVDQLDRKVDQLDRKVDQLAYQAEQRGKLLTIVSEQVDTLADLVKLSVQRHEATDQRLDLIISELQRQATRQDAVVDILKNVVKRQETTDTRLDSAVQTQLQMLQLMRLNADQTDDHARRLPAVEGQGSRIQRLEDEVFRAAS